ncbi:MAG TPA: hypothetical protein VGC77_15290 [Rhodopseudomonas sp.]|uniref:hypothetical protein n=1 Tax=Rhodopseudomonas sp. TaxID=1078 RepID=UPI002ED8AD73
MTNREIYLLSLPVIATLVVAVMAVLIRYRPWHRKPAITAAARGISSEQQLLIRRLNEVFDRLGDDASRGAPPVEPKPGEAVKADR